MLTMSGLHNPSAEESSREQDDSREVFRTQLAWRRQREKWKDQHWKYQKISGKKKASERWPSSQSNQCLEIVGKKILNWLILCIKSVLSKFTSNENSDPIYVVNHSRWWVIKNKKALKTRNFKFHLRFVHTISKVKSYKGTISHAT